MELVELKNNEMLVAKFNQEKNVIFEVEKCHGISTATRIGKENSCTFRKHLRLQVNIFNDEVLEKRVSHTIVGRKPGVSTKADGIQRGS